MTKFAPYAKAITAAIAAGLGALYQALDNDAVTAQEWVGVALALVGALGAVWAVPNAVDTKGRHEAGHVNLVAVAAVLVIVVCLVILF